MTFRDKLLTDFGRHLYDYSSIKKSECHTSVMLDLAESFAIRETVELIEVCQDAELPYAVIRAEATMHLYQKWSSAFRDFGYSAPILICVE